MAATALDEVAAGWPLCPGGQVGNRLLNFPNVVWRRVSICAGKKDMVRET